MMKPAKLLPFSTVALLVAWIQSAVASAAPGQHSRYLLEGVVSLIVLDADRGVQSNDGSWDFMELVDGSVIDLDHLGSITEEDVRGVHWGTARINIRANTEGDVGSVVFDYDEGEFISVVLVGDDPYETLMWDRDFVFTNGYHTLKVTGLSGNNGDGSELAYVEVGFTVVSEVAEGAQNVPAFTSDWISLERYPLDVGEAPSALLGSTLVVFNGFQGRLTVTNNVLAFDLENPSATSWRQLTSYPIEEGVTHIPIAVHGLKAYLLGGYIGRRRPAPDISNCYEFDLEGDGGNGSWRVLPSLPSGRGGGGAFYAEEINTIVYSLGATRSREDGTIDRLTTWWLDLSHEDAGWVQKNDGPYLGNHIKEAVAKDCDGEHHYFLLGGQFAEEEKDHNLDDVWEYFPDTDHWEERASMIMPRGHLATGEYSCGFLIAAGAIDYYPSKGLKTYDVSYYDIPSDTWTRIGDAPDNRNTYACAVYNDAFFCTAGGKQDFSVRHLGMPNPTPMPMSTPTIMPTKAMPTKATTTIPGSRPKNEPLYKLNCGGPSGEGWESDDPYVVYGKAVHRGDAFDPMGPNFIFNTERHDLRNRGISYSFPKVPDGTYVIQFMFAEVQSAVKTNERVFSFHAEGLPIPEITDYDIFAQVGFKTPIIVTIDVTVSDGNGLQIESSATVDDAKIQGLIITPKRTAIYKINCGGDEVAHGWETDDYYTLDGRKETRRRFGDEDPDLFLFNTERHDVGRQPIVYDFPVDGIGPYNVDIYWMEAQPSNAGIGLRLMDVYVENGLVLDDFDVYDYAVGALAVDGEGARNSPFIYTIHGVEVDDGSLTLSFEAVVDDAKVNGIVITTN